MRTVLFYRDYRKFHGGHQKVWDYFNHVLASPEFVPRIVFSPRSNWDPTNPWRDAKNYVVDSWRSVRPDVFFVAGRDWSMLDHYPDAADDIPVVNLIQHVRHADPRSNRFAFLSRRAIRICVSAEVAEALHGTGLTRGPLIVIPDGLDLTGLPAPDDLPREVDVLIVALKQPDLGRKLIHRLKRPDRCVALLSERLPRTEFLDRILGAKTVLFLPNETEGFYLPALEGMALGTLVVCPDCVGNRSFCLPGHNAFRPDYELGELVQATEVALTLPRDEAQRMRANARQTAEEHSLLAERRAFLQVLHHIDQIWRGEAVCDGADSYDIMDA